MIWKKRNKYDDVGKERVVKRFALFPKIVYQQGQHYIVWLQHYMSHEAYEVWQDPTCGAEGCTWNVKRRQLIENHH